MRLYSLSEIAALISEADRLSLSDNELKYSQVRNIVRRGLLKGSVRTDERGTQAFPVLEVYRARILTCLADFSMDVSEFGHLDDAEMRRYQILPPQYKNIWFGLRSIVQGVAAGEKWTLEIKHYAPGIGMRKRFSTAFVWEGDPHHNAEQVNELFETGPARASLIFDLNALFAGLPEIQE